jgi:glycosyltransferase involved in cell wall biosynthesis
MENASACFTLGCRNHRDYPSAMLRLRTLLRHNRVDILHASEAIQGAISGLASRATDTKCVYHRHHASDIHANNLSRVAAWSSDMTMAVSDAAAAHARNRDIFNRSKIVVAHNGIPDHREVAPVEVQRLRSSLGLREQDRVVLSVGNLRPEKGHSFLLASLAQTLRESSDGVHLVIVGDGPEREELAQRTRSFKGRVHVVGHQDDVAPWYTLADVVAVPSLQESFGLSAIEAMSAAKPVVANRVGGLPEIVAHEQTGLLVPAGDLTGFRTAVETLVSDPDKAMALGVAGRARYLSTFTTAHMVDAWTEAYERVTA